jgi:hypothetical protein
LARKVARHGAKSGGNRLRTGGIVVPNRRSVPYWLAAGAYIIREIPGFFSVFFVFSCLTPA